MCVDSCSGAALPRVPKLLQPLRCLGLLTRLLLKASRVGMVNWLLLSLNCLSCSTREDAEADADRSSFADDCETLSADREMLSADCSIMWQACCMKCEARLLGEVGERNSSSSEFDELSALDMSEKDVGHAVGAPVHSHRALSDR